MQITFNVVADTEPYEFVRVVGNVLELGEWNVEESVKLTHSGSVDRLWSCKIDVKNVHDVEYRYLISRQLRNVHNEYVTIVTKWETHLTPRLYDVRNGYHHNDEFGRQNDELKVDDGWLTKQSEIRLIVRDRQDIDIKNFNNDSDELSLYVTPVGMSNFIIYPNEGDTKVNRDDYLCTNVQYSVLNEAYKYTPFDLQPRYGCPFIKGDYLMFRTHTLLKRHLAFRFDFYSSEQQTTATHSSSTPNEKHRRKKLIGSCLLPPITYDTCGVTCCDIVRLDGGAMIGHVKVHYLLINPVSASLENYFYTDVTYTRHWKRRPTLNIGHRGMGKSFTMKAACRENTIRSFNKAADCGADFVEFDVQLTKDHKVVVFHDFEVLAEAEKRRCGKNNNKTTTKHRIWLKDAALEELHELKLFHQSEKSPQLNSADDEEFNEPFPLLRDVLLKVDPETGFNVEIKYPMQTSNGVWECEHFFEHNLYVDKILSIIFKYSSARRKIIFSSFEPNICVMLKLKQNKFPVLFLSQGATKRYTPYVDALCNSSKLAIDFTLCNDLLGVCLHSEDLLTNEKPIKISKQSNLVCFVWGNDLVEDEVQEKFRDMECDGIIFDKINEANLGKIRDAK